MWCLRGEREAGKRNAVQHYLQVTVNGASQVEVIHSLGDVVCYAEASAPIERALNVAEHVLERALHQLGHKKGTTLRVDTSPVERQQVGAGCGCGCGCVSGCEGGVGGAAR